MKHPSAGASCAPDVQPKEEARTPSRTIGGSSRPWRVRLYAPEPGGTKYHVMFRASSGDGAVSGSKPTVPSTTLRPAFPTPKSLAASPVTAPEPVVAEILRDGPELAGLMPRTSDS